MKKKVSKEKVYILSKEEKDRLVAIRNVSNYLVDLIRGDMNMFVADMIKPRLGIAKEMNVTVDIDKGTVITVPPVEDKAVEEIKPALEKVEEKKEVETKPKAVNPIVI